MIKKWRAALNTSLIGGVLCVVLLVASPGYAQCPADIISLWALDEDNGALLSDSVGVNDGVGNQNPTPVAGIVEGAQQFDGAGTGVDVVADDSFNWTYNASFTIEYWIRRAGVAFSNPIAEVAVGRDDGATSAMQWWTGLWADDGTAAFVLIGTDGTGTGNRATGEFLEGDDDLTDGIWHHVAVVRDALTNQTRLYVDGVLNDSVDITYAVDEGFDSATAPLQMGWLEIQNTSGFHLNGTLDEVAIYDRALTANEILRHYNDELSYCAVRDDDKDKDKNGGGGGGGSCFIESLR